MFPVEYTPESYEELQRYISDEEIFYHYFGAFENDHWYPSPFRKETKPSFTISYYNGRWVWRDFGLSNKPKHAINLVMKLYDLNLNQAVDRIYNDLVNDQGERVRATKKAPVAKEKNVSCKFWKLKDWEQEYWKDIGVNADACNHYNIKGGEIWNDNKRVMKGSEYQSYPCFIYVFDQPDRIWKAYSPKAKEKQLKFFSNNITNHVQNYNELDNTHNFWGVKYTTDVLFITSSYKDCIILNSLGYHAIAPHAESMFLAPWDIDYLKTTFEHLYVFYDNDSTGITKCTEFTNQYKLNYINIPSGVTLNGVVCKDPDEIVRNFGLKEGYDILKNIIHDKFERDGI